MPELDDHELLAEFVGTHSEPAFAALVARHLNLVYSTALRFTGNPHHAEEITQAVFIILAQKAGKLSARIVLSGWLYQVARFTTANFLKGEIRRQHREQEAYMQTILNEPDALTWQQIAPLLDEAMGGLGETDRNAIVLRFFENKTAAEAACQLNLTEAATHKRVNRALEKLRKFFTKRDVSSTAVIIAGAISANSVQAAPVALAKSVTAVAIAKSAAATASTLTLVKGALKIMAWTKMKMAIVVGVTILAVGTGTVAVEKIHTQFNSVLTQRLEDGSTLVLSGVSFGDNHQFGFWHKRNAWNWPGHKELGLEFRLVSNDVATNPLVKPAFYRQFRIILHGEQGIEYVEEFMPNEFKENAGSYYGYVQTSIFPRDSRWLWVRIEKREDWNKYDSWQKIAEFKFTNPASPTDQKWIAKPPPTTNTVAGMSFVLGEITVKTVPNLTNDIWNHVVTVPTEVWSKDVLLTNWLPTYVQAADASGNWCYYSRFPAWRSLDPSYLWKLEMDFEPESNFSSESLVTIKLSASQPKQKVVVVTTNVMDVPVTISWDGSWLDATMPTNRTELALKFVGTTNDKGESGTDGSGSWGQFQFRKGNFMVRRDGVLNMGDFKLSSVTIAIVPNIHTTFYAKPRLVTE